MSPPPSPGPIVVRAGGLSHEREVSLRSGRRVSQALRDQGRAYAAKLIASGVPTVFREAKGQIHGSITLRQAIPSAQGDLAGCLAALRGIINEAGADLTMMKAAAE